MGAPTWMLLGSLLGLGVGLLVGALWVRTSYVQRLSRQSLDHAEERSALKAEQARLQERLEQEARSAGEKLAQLEGAREQLKKEFSLLAKGVLEA